MIAYINGEITAVEEDRVVIEAYGIGYRVFVPSTEVEHLSVGDEVRLHTHLSMREDGMTLFGFSSRDALTMFRLLLGVSGIGPKGALSVLSVLDPDDLRFAVLSDDVATISKVPGIGKKTALKLILELKDKLDLEEAFEAKASHAKSQAGTPSAQQEAIEALSALGYPATDAMKAVRTVVDRDGDAPVEDLIKGALRIL